MTTYWWHWVLIIVIVYLIAVKFPGLGNKFYSTIGM